MSMDDLSTAEVTKPEADIETAPVAGLELDSHAPDPHAQDPHTQDPHALATQLVGKLCHDFISPAGAIMSGLDLLEDPSAQDMKQEALNLISASAKKLVTLVHFARVAFGAATSAEAFSAGQLKTILADVFSTMRAELDFDIPADVVFEKPAARALLNLGLIAGNALPVGGSARLTMSRDDQNLNFVSESRGPRARLKPEAIEGLTGLPLGEGLSGQWIQPHWLYSVVHAAKGTITITSDVDALFLHIQMPVEVAVAEAASGPAAQDA